MFLVNIKGKQNPKLPHLVKLEAIFFKTGYARVSKVISISGSLSEWNGDSQQFTSKSADSVELNKRLLEFKTKYLKVAEEWELEGKEWAPVQWSHCFETESQVKVKPTVLPLQQVLQNIIAEKFGKECIKNGQVVTSFGTAKSYMDVMERLTDFVKAKYNCSISNFYFNEITEDFVYDFALFLQKRVIERGNKGGVSSRLRRLYGVWSC